jgi:hypothetical protein
MATLPDPRKNQLLAALPEPELRRWLPHLEYVTCAWARCCMKRAAY